MSISKTKFYHIYGKAVDSKGETHHVTVVAKLYQTRHKEIVHEPTQVETKPNCFSEGLLTFEVKRLKRKLTLGLSICHPSDTFDEQIGIDIAKKRIKRGENIGELETNDVTMLTEDAIMGELFVKLQHITNHIDDYISEN